MATERHAEVSWQGSLMDGSGRIEGVGTGAFGPLDVSWPARTEDPEELTSPEELIAAAHAACFSMALSHELAEGGNAPERLDTRADVAFEPGKESRGSDSPSAAGSPASTRGLSARRPRAPRPAARSRRRSRASPRSRSRRRSKADRRFEGDTIGGCGVARFSTSA